MSSDLAQGEAYEADETQEAFTWQASEYIHHQKKTTWFIAFFGLVAAMATLAVIFQQWTSLMVLGAMVAALTVYANKEPRVLSYSLTETGITIGDKHHAYDEFKSFAVLQDLAWHAIDLEPLQRFMPRMTILFDDEHLNEIVARLSQHLPREDRNPDIIERLTRYLRF
jgi:hypothetical protein